MRSHLIAVVVTAMGCGETPTGPFAALPLDARLEIDGLDGVVHVARDRFGIAHVHATTPGDLGYAQGYVMAHDRLPQMELLRRYASGTLAEIYGNDDAVVAADIAMRFHRMRKFAVDTWNELQVSEVDADLVENLTQFAAGVNAYVDHAVAGRWPVDPQATDSGVFLLFSPAQFERWTPVDSIVIMRFFTFAQSWTVPEELAFDELDVRVRAVAPELANDLLAFAPIEPQQPRAASPPDTPNRPAVPAELLTSARAFFALPTASDRSRALLPNAFLRPALGSSAFVVGLNYTGEQLETAKAILAADMHGLLSNPSLFYPMHQILETEPGFYERDVLGLLLPGCPVAVAGTNGAIGWAPTLGTHDLNDVYLETLVQGGTASLHGGVAEPLASFSEEIRIGEYGIITGSRTQTYELVPRHGPVIPNHPPDAALSIRYQGYAATRELSTLWHLGGFLTRTVDEAQSWLRGMQHGPSYLLVDLQGASAWTTFADVPDRPAAARRWTPELAGGAAPFFVLDGTNPDHEWAAAPMDRDQLPIVFGFEGAIVVA
ncbi:MAG TPA: penicillin acylase family protein, partial [Xanthomonadales bacterium]|nr:penicillin acylase family protein [Xanthomonadales bacterium]